MKKEKKQSKFKKGLLIYTAVMLAALAVGLTVFWFFIQDYENGMPVHGMERTMESFNEEKISDLISDQTFGNAGALEDSSVWVSWYQELIRGKHLTFEEARENTATTPTYLVKADDQPVGKVTLKVTGKNAFKFNLWGFDRLDVSEYLPETATYTVTVPKGTTVTVNGHVLGEEYITENDVVYPELSNIQTYLSEVPLSTTYKISGLLNEPEIAATTGNGRELTLEKDDHNYAFSYAMSDAEIAPLKTMAEGVVNSYAMNFIDVSKQIYNYIMPGSELEENIKLTVTGFYPTKYIASYGFDSMNVSNFNYYSDSCFSCDVQYNFHVKFQNFTVEQESLPGNMRWYFVNKDGKWYLTDLGYLNEES